MLEGVQHQPAKMVAVHDGRNQMPLLHETIHTAGTNALRPLPRVGTEKWRVPHDADKEGTEAQSTARGSGDAMKEIKYVPGTFVDSDGREKYEPPKGHPFPILCGEWPNAHAHAIQRMCVICADPIGVSPKGIAYHEVNPELRPLLCKDCFAVMTVLLQEGAVKHGNTN
jgi:hypothetical protein